MKTDLLFIAAHPDDVELCCAGTVIRHVEAGHVVGVVDLTAGELGTRGNAELRAQEAARAAEIMGIAFRDNLGLRDGFFDLSESNKLPIIRAVRKYRPEVVVTNALMDRHPDHGRAAQLVKESCFLAGLPKIETTDAEGNNQAAWRPKKIYHMIQDRYMHPSVCVDITGYFDRKVESIMAFKSQFHDPDSDEPVTPISRPDFMGFWEARFREMGRLIGTEFAEGYVCEWPEERKNLL
jgi:bacillithiol biosynthesis deacetylase BshB1